MKYILINLKSWFGELLNKNNSFKFRLVRFLARERIGKNLLKNIFGFKSIAQDDKNFKRLKLNGYIELPKIKSIQINKIISEIELLKFYGRNDLKNPVSGKTLLKKISNSFKRKNDLKHPLYRKQNIMNDCPEIKKIAYNKKVFSLVKNYLGSEKIIIDSQIWFTFNSGETEDEKHLFGWHYDIDDLGWLKLFIYLSDVDISNGPHEFIKFSHNYSNLKKIIFRRIDSQKIFDLFGFKKNEIKTFLGPQGTNFLEDTFGYHRGLKPKKSRAILQLTYRLGVV